MQHWLILSRIEGHENSPHIHLRNRATSIDPLRVRKIRLRLI